LEHVLVLVKVPLLLYDIYLLKFFEIALFQIYLVVNHVGDLSFVDFELVVGEEDLDLVSGVKEKVLLDVLHVAVFVVFLQDLLLNLDAVGVPDLLEDVCGASSVKLWILLLLILKVVFYLHLRKMV